MEITVQDLVNTRQYLFTTCTVICAKSSWTSSVNSKIPNVNVTADYAEDIIGDWDNTIDDFDTGKKVVSISSKENKKTCS